MTKFKDIYDKFLRKIDDIDVANYDDDMLNEFLERGLLESVETFKPYCKTGLDIDNENKCFVNDLSSYEQKILANYMLLDWLEPYMNNADNLINTLNTSDFKAYSPKGMLEAVKKFYYDTQKRVRLLVNEYTLLDEDYTSWKN